MYLTYYGLTKEPFHITPDPDFLFLTEGHRQALGSLIYGIEKRKGFVVITGGIGVGKTTIVRFYLERWRNPRLRIVYIFNPTMTFGQLVKTLCRELGFRTKSEDVHDLVRELHAALVAQYQLGVNVALIIDEAQNLPPETLESLRLLSNLETAKDKLLQMVFIGQPEFEKNIDRDDMRQFRQRIAIRTSIDPLTPKESLSYIQHRLEKAGARNGQIFSRGAVRSIVKEANGIPRLLNILCDNALITGLGYQTKPVTQGVTREVIADFRGKKKRPGHRCLVLALLLVLFMAGAGYLAAAGHLPEVTALYRSLSSSPAPESPVVEAPQPRALTKPEVKERQADRVQETPEKRDTTIVRVMEKGENLSRLLKEVYGVSDKELGDGRLMALIRKNNPQIRDMNRIPVGSEIIFPVAAGKEEGGARE